MTPFQSDGATATISRSHRLRIGGGGAIARAQPLDRLGGIAEQETLADRLSEDGADVGEVVVAGLAGAPARLEPVQKLGHVVGSNEIYWLVTNSS